MELKRFKPSSGDISHESEWESQLATKSSLNLVLSVLFFCIDIWLAVPADRIIDDSNKELV